MLFRAGFSDDTLKLKDNQGTFARMPLTGYHGSEGKRGMNNSLWAGLRGQHRASSAETLGQSLLVDSTRLRVWCACCVSMLEIEHLMAKTVLPLHWELLNWLDSFSFAAAPWEVMSWVCRGRGHQELIN